jgi:hypothetical protein
MVPSPCFNNKLCIVALVDFLPEVDRGSIMEVSLNWILAVVLCPALVARGLLYFLFIVATGGRVALIVLAVFIPRLPWPPLGMQLTTRYHHGAQMSRADS